MIEPPTIADELQRKHEQALMDLAADFDNGVIDARILARATEAVATAVAGLVGTNALSEMSQFIRTNPSQPLTQRRVFVHKKTPLALILALTGEKITLTELPRSGTDIGKPEKSTILTCLNETEAVRKYAALAEKISGTCLEL